MSFWFVAEYPRVCAVVSVLLLVVFSDRLFALREWFEDAIYRADDRMFHDQAVISLRMEWLRLSGMVVMVAGALTWLVLVCVLFSSLWMVSIG